VYLLRQRQLYSEPPPEASVIDPLLPMPYLKFSDALILANITSAWAGLSNAYEVENLSRSPVSGIGDYAGIRVRLTGNRGFRVPTIEEWNAIAPSDWHKRSDSFRCLHANLADQGSSCYDGYRFLAPVASYLPTPSGLYDIWGNANEWGQPPLAAFDKDGYFREESFDRNHLRVPLFGGNYYDDSSVLTRGHGWGYATVQPTAYGELGFYGTTVRLVIEPDQGRCPILNLSWTWSENIYDETCTTSEKIKHN
jgi:hypothetical protein